MVTGVYEIKNKLNNKRYVGSSVNINKRFSEHLNLLRNDKHHSCVLQLAWNKYGEKHFEFNLLETCEPIKETLLFLEQKYLDLSPEYNICKVAGNTQGVVFSEKRKDKIRAANSARIIKESTRLKHSENSKNSVWNSRQRVSVCATKNNEELVFKSITEAALFTGSERNRIGIRRCLQRKQKSAYGYTWKINN